MQVVAIWAHLFYWINLTDSEPPAAWMNMLFWRLGTPGALQNTRNLYKWLEYAVSATLGTVAVFLSSGDQPTNTLLLLVTLSATIQTVGYSLDQVENHAGGNTAVGASSWPELVQWASAAAGQIVDFIVVAGAVSDHWTATATARSTSCPTLWGGRCLGCGTCGSWCDTAPATATTTMSSFGTACSRWWPRRRSLGPPAIIWVGIQARRSDPGPRRFCCALRLVNQF